VRGDESWVHHFGLEGTVNGISSQRITSTKKKWKIATSAGKVMHTVFCNVKDVVHSESMPSGTTINSILSSD
jgi:hypothetical protein